jgi:hypothetical protein
MVALPTLLYYASVGRLNRPDIVRIEPGEGIYLLSRNFPNLLNGGVGAARFQKNCDAGNTAFAGFVHQVEHHIVWLTLNVFFAGTVKVELRESVALVSHNQKVSACRGVVVHSYCVAVVN